MMRCKIVQIFPEDKNPTICARLSGKCLCFELRVKVIDLGYGEGRDIIHFARSEFDAVDLNTIGSALQRRSPEPNQTDPNSKQYG
jgi:hypothetical protein